MITTLLRREYQGTGHVNLKRFYLRRLYRIIPPLYLVLIILIILAELGVIPSAMKGFGVGAQFAQLTNYYLMFFDQEEGPTLVPYTTQTWSLSVEEHFYLLYPILAIFLLRRLRYTQIAAVFVGICAVCLFWRLCLVDQLGLSRHYVYYATDTRLDSILFGCIMGMWANPMLDRQDIKISSTAWGAMLGVGVLLIVVSTASRSPSFQETYRYTLQGAGLFPIFFCAVRYSEWPIFSWLNSRPMRGLGLISYTFYLSHLACLRITQHIFGANLIVDAVVGLCAAILFSSASYFLMERHLAAVRRRLHRESSVGRAD